MNDPRTILPAQRWLEFVQVAIRAARHVHRALGRVSGGWHLSDAEMLLLWSCAQPSPPNGFLESELATSLGLTSSQWSAALYDLRDRGLISFQRLPDDEARRPLTITPLGEAALADIARALSPLTAPWDSEVGEAELQDCIKLLRRLMLVPCSGSQVERGSRTGESAQVPRLTRLHRGAA